MRKWIIACIKILTLTIPESKSPLCFKLDTEHKPVREKSVLAERL